MISDSDSDSDSFDCADAYNLRDSPYSPGHDRYHQDRSWGRRCSACDSNHVDPLTQEKIRSGHGFCSQNTCYDAGGPFNDGAGSPVLGRFRAVLAKDQTHPITRQPMTVQNLDTQLNKGDWCETKEKSHPQDQFDWNRWMDDAEAWEASDAWKHGEAEVKEARKPSIKKVTHRRRGCNEFPELNEGEPEPRGWCPVQRCYRHTEAGKRVCRSAAPFSPQLYPEFSRDLVLQRAQIEAQIEEDEAMARQFERDEERSVDGRSAVEQLPYGWREAIDPRGIPYYYFFDGRTRQTQWDRPTHPIWHPSSQNPRQIHCSVCGQAGHNRRTHARRSGKK